jgi:membrane protein YqaA with SNARE-associated domain
MTETTQVVRPGAFRRLYNWILRNAEGPYAWAALAAIAFAEASFFPMIPDVVMAPMVLADRKRWLQIALWCTMWSVIGGALGYAIGNVFYSSIGHWLLSLYGEAAQVDAFRARFAHNAWIILVFGLFTPYKLVTISAGIAAVPFPLFMAFSAITRSIRFLAVGALLRIYGEPVRGFLDKRLEQVLIAIVLAIVAAFVALRLSFTHFF